MKLRQTPQGIALFTLLAAWLIALCLPAAAAGAGPAGAELGDMRRQEWLIPSPVKGVLMRAILFRPAGDGPFPLAIVSHGSSEDARERRRQRLAEFPYLSRWLVARGYAVLLPQRPGHGDTGGKYIEGQGWCGGPDYIGAARGTALSIATAYQYMLEQDFIADGGAIVVGNSAGGWGGLAYSGSAPAGVVGIVNFAGGRGGRDQNRANNNCAPDRLVEAAGVLGASSRVPTLWLYAENDTFFGPELSRRMAEAFAAAGGRAEYHLLPPVRGDGHALMSTEGDEASWAPVLAKFLGRLR
jgi:dienelactone hydrolase